MWGNERVKAAIKLIDDKTKEESVASRQLRQEFWTDTMNNAKSMADRLRASELLGRSEADFTDNINNSDTQQAKPLTAEETAELKELAKHQTRPRIGTKTG